MRSFVVVCSLLSVVMLSGCGSLMDKPFQKIAINTTGVGEVDCALRTPGHLYRVIAPGVALIERSRHPLEIICEKGNYYTAKAVVKSERILAHGILNVWNGFVPGRAYDAASGSIFAYPEEIVIPMEKDPYARTTAVSGLTVVEPLLPRAAPATYPGELRATQNSAKENTETNEAMNPVKETLNKALGKY